MASSMASVARAGVADFRAKLFNGDRRTAAVVAAALLCAVMPLDIPQLLLVLVGAASCALFQPLAVPRPRLASKSINIGSAKGSQGSYGAPGGRQPLARQGAGSRSRLPAPRSECKPQALPAGLPAATTSFQPVVAPTFAAAGWDAQVDELVGPLVPTPASRSAVERIGARVQAIVQKAVPEAEVVAFASSAVLRGGANGVAVPDVDVVVSCLPSTLSDRLAGRQLDRRQLQKSALRALTDRLNETGEFKFRRSAFSADEPKVTMLATVGADAVPFDLSINTATPLHNAALITDCGRLDARARALILLVRRWARDRAICHAVKGHLSPYCWTLLAIYFLQVGEEGGDKVLPPLCGFAASSGLAADAEPDEAGRSAGIRREEPSSQGAKSVGALFRDFIAFYAGRFDARGEAVSVRSGRRAAPSPRLPLHVIAESRRSREVAPSIEDPFEPTRNLAAGMSALGLARWREELARATALLHRGGEEASLAELLEPWSPPVESPQ